MTEENEGNGEFQSQDSLGIENASDNNEANTDDVESCGRRKWWKKGNKDQRDSKNKEQIPKKKSKRKDKKRRLLLAIEEREVLIGGKDLCINKLSEKNERILRQMRDSEISFSERISILETALHEKDQREKETNLADEQQARLRLEDELREARETCAELERTLENERLLRETTRQDVQAKEDTIRAQSQLLQQERELKSGLEERVGDLQIQVSESEHRQRELQETLGDEQQARLTLEEELRQARDTLSELEKRLENELSFRETSRRNLRTKEDTIREQSQLLQQERELKSGLEERVRDMQIQIEVERNRRIATEREVREERINLQQDRENLEREREIWQQRIRNSERTVLESQRRQPELQSAATAAEEDDWIIGRDEVILSERSLGVGAWGNVYEGTFRGCQVAVKQIHDLILSPHNRRLFEREMSIASRCRHPHLLQFIGATNNDGSPLFITELLDSDLRDVLRQRPLLHEEVVCIALDVAKALNYLHLKKPSPIIHRDISSSNVLLWTRDNCWRAKLSDYGAANFMRQHMTSNPGASIYAAPESQTSQQSPKVSTNSDYTFQLPFITGKYIFINIKLLFILINVKTV